MPMYLLMPASSPISANSQSSTAQSATDSAVKNTPAEKPSDLSAINLEERLIEDVNLLLRRLQEVKDLERYREMLFAMGYGIAKHPTGNMRYHAAKGVLDYVAGHHFDLYGFLQNSHAYKIGNNRKLLTGSNASR